MNLEPKLKYHKKSTKLHHIIGLICPMCKSTTSMGFVTSKNIIDEELQNIINGLKSEFKFKHILNCKG